MSAAAMWYCQGGEEPHETIDNNNEEEKQEVDDKIGDALKRVSTKQKSLMGNDE